MLQSRMRGEKLADDRDALFGRGQVVEAEFEEGFAGVRFAPRVFQQLLRRRKNPWRCRCEVAKMDAT